MRKPTLKSLKNKADKLLSIFVRTRDSDGNTNTCVTCGALKHWKELQAGHFYRRVHLATRWDERNVWPQCGACNVLRRGNYASYAKFMYEKFPKEVIDELHELHRKPFKLTRDYLEGVIAKFTGLIRLVDYD